MSVHTNQLTAREDGCSMTPSVCVSVPEGPRLVQGIRFWTRPHVGVGVQVTRSVPEHKCSTGSPANVSVLVEQGSAKKVRYLIRLGVGVDAQELSDALETSSSTRTPAPVSVQLCIVVHLHTTSIPSYVGASVLRAPLRTAHLHRSLIRIRASVIAPKSTCALPIKDSTRIHVSVSAVVPSKHAAQLKSSTPLPVSASVPLNPQGVPVGIYLTRISANVGVPTYSHVPESSSSVLRLADVNALAQGHNVRLHRSTMMLHASVNVGVEKYALLSRYLMSSSANVDATESKSARADKALIPTRVNVNVYDKKSVPIRRFSTQSHANVDVHTADTIAPNRINTLIPTHAVVVVHQQFHALAPNDRTQTHVSVSVLMLAARVPT